MYIESKTFIVKEGFGQEIINKFANPKRVLEAEGFIDLTVMKNVKKGESEEIICQLKWESQEAFTKWKTSDAHKAGHQNGNKEKPDYIIDVKMNVYNVEILKTK